MAIRTFHRLCGRYVPGPRCSSSAWNATCSATLAGFAAAERSGEAVEPHVAAWATLCSAAGDELNASIDAIDDAAYINAGPLARFVFSLILRFRPQ
jgi:hypothetical protein